MSYSIELSFNNREEFFEIPIMPGSIEASESSSNKTYDIIALGEINVIKAPKLSGYGFSSIFPAQRYPFVIAQRLLQPIEYVQLIIKWMESKRPIRFVFVSDRFDINTLASIEGFDWKEVAGGSGDIEYSIKLKKYVSYAAKKVPNVTPIYTAASTALMPPPAPARPNETKPPKTYTLVAGDTLWAVAQKHLGNGARWPEIQKLNGITDAEIKRLQIGRVLKLP
ncbi:LysM domain-containing protein [Desulfitobacterium dehalogenans ATCC 51507]|uniref:LysM domain-containing protein n=1 Tax=Desulfitobacterium dehalogenans (strain ATCC 51507 / DSM 9161 / JW/IU-DC1) TaxID=756499 RepID=I4A6E6_DESDJ|nr:LysM domain-containing protein [Desulfitobacterium dehalogenans]AFL99530.1 LysM domain-containing protein [Desulfitobacterium dehalogenans ATCC 51507]